MVSITLEKDGKQTDLFGPNPQGRLIRDADGHVFYIATRGDLPKFASNNRAAGTPEENKAVVEGSISYFGTVTTNEAEKTSITHIEVCTFPNWIGVERKNRIASHREWLAPKRSNFLKRTLNYSTRI